MLGHSLASRTHAASKRTIAPEPVNVVLLASALCMGELLFLLVMYYGRVISLGSYFVYYDLLVKLE